MPILILKRLYDSGELAELVRGGFVSVNIIVWIKIHNAYQLQLKTGSKKSMAAQEVADVFGIDKRSVYRILKRLE